MLFILNNSFYRKKHMTCVSGITLRLAHVRKRFLSLRMGRQTVPSERATGKQVMNMERWPPAKVFLQFIIRSFRRKLSKIRLYQCGSMYIRLEVGPPQAVTILSALIGSICLYDKTGECLTGSSDSRNYTHESGSLGS